MELNNIQAIDKHIAEKAFKRWQQEFNDAQILIKGNRILSKIKIKYGDKDISLENAILIWPNYNNVEEVKQAVVANISEEIANDFIRTIRHLDLTSNKEVMDIIM